MEKTENVVNEMIDAINREKDRIIKKLNEIVEENIRTLVENKNDIKSTDMLNDILEKIINNIYKDINSLLRKSKEHILNTKDIKLDKLLEEEYKEKYSE